VTTSFGVRRRRAWVARGDAALAALGADDDAQRAAWCAGMRQRGLVRRVLDQVALLAGARLAGGGRGRRRPWRAAHGPPRRRLVAALVSLKEIDRPTTCSPAGHGAGPRRPGRRVAAVLRRQEFELDGLR
jgi:hypothetical protein